MSETCSFPLHIDIGKKEFCLHVLLEKQSSLVQTFFCFSGVVHSSNATTTKDWACLLCLASGCPLEHHSLKMSGCPSCCPPSCSLVPCLKVVFLDQMSWLLEKFLQCCAHELRPGARPLCFFQSVHSVHPQNISAVFHLGNPSSMGATSETQRGSCSHLIKDSCCFVICRRITLWATRGVSDGPIFPFIMPAENASDKTQTRGGQSLISAGALGPLSVLHMCLCWAHGSIEE